MRQNQLRSIRRRLAVWVLLDNNTATNLSYLITSSLLLPLLRQRHFRNVNGGVQERWYSIRYRSRPFFMLQADCYNIMLAALSIAYLLVVLDSRLACLGLGLFRLVVYSQNSCKQIEQLYHLQYNIMQGIPQAHIA